MNLFVVVLRVRPRVALQVDEVLACLQVHPRSEGSPPSAAEAGNVRPHAFTFVSNHFYLLVWARGAALASFMQYLRANLSRKVGRLVDPVLGARAVRAQHPHPFPLFSFPPRVTPGRVARIL